MRIVLVVILVVVMQITIKALFKVHLYATGQGYFQAATYVVLGSISVAIAAWIAVIVINEGWWPF